MRDYIGIDPWAQKDARLRRDLGVIDYFLRDLSRGVARIQQGEVPDGSGTPIADANPDSGLWFKLLGRPGNQVAHGGTSASGSATIASTTHATKGKVFFGNAHNSAYDELSEILGIGTSSPTAVGHFVGNPQPATSEILATSTQSLPGSWSLVGAATLHQCVNDSSNATYATNNGVTGTIGLVRAADPGANPGVTAATLKVTIQRTGSAATTTFNYDISRQTGGFSKSKTGVVGSSSFTTDSLAFTGTDITNFWAGSGYVEFAMHSSGINPSDSWEVSRIWLEYTTTGSSAVQTILIAERTASSTQPYAKFIDESDVVVTQVTSTGKVSSTVAPQWDTAAATTGDLWVASDNDGNGDWTATSALTVLDVLDSVFRVVGSSDSTKKLAFEVDGFTTNQTRTLTPQDASYTIAGINIANLFTKAQTVNVDSNAVNLTLTAIAGQTAKIFEFYSTGGTTLNASLDPNGGLFIRDAVGDAPLTLQSGSFYVQLYGMSGFLDNRTWRFPELNNADNVFVAEVGTQTLTGKTFGTNCIANVSTQTTGFSFADQSSPTRRLRVQLSGATGNNLFRINSSAAKIYDFPDASITVAGSASALTSTRVPFATTGGILTDSGNMTFATDTLSVNKVAMSSLTSSRIPYASTAGLLIDISTMTFVTDTLSVPKVAMSSLTSTRIPYASTAGLLVDTSGFTFTSGDTLTVPKIVNGTSLQVAGGAVLTALTAGVYTPTRSAETNLDANVAPAEAQYLRVGNTVTVSGSVGTVNPTAAGATQFELSLPVASNLGSAVDLSGVGFCGAVAGFGIEIVGSTANDTAVFQWVAVDTSARSISYTYSYQVI